MWESINIRMLGRNKEILFDLLEEAKQLALKAEEGRTIIYTSFGSEWRQFGAPRRKRPLESVILPEGFKDKIVKDVREFMENSQWYIDRGIPHRRGYLLFGTPGSGKSSMIQALAGELSHNICLLSLSERGLTDDRLNHLLANAPERSIILLEDVDACFPSRDGAEAAAPVTGPSAHAHNYGYGYTPNVTLSGLLNALDGVAAAEGRILFMTTNHIARLDSALIRPGRVDVKIPLDWATSFQISELFGRFYPDTTEDVRQRFIAAIPANKVSMAQLTGLLLLHKTEPEACIAAVPSWLQTLSGATTARPPSAAEAFASSVGKAANDIVIG